LGDKRFEVTLLRALALEAQGDRDRAVSALLEALALAEPGGFIRSFVDEGASMATLLSAAEAQGRMTDLIRRLRRLFEAEPQPQIDTLSQREIEVLRLIAQGLSNQEIGERLFLALDTVKGHNRKIFGKLQVQRRTEAVARARELGLA
jgi:LuxR family maltose regulon positive regulatory protein